MGLAVALRPFSISSPRTVLWTTLITGCVVFAAYAHHAISSTPISYTQVSTSPALAAAFPRWALWSSAVQVAAAALALGGRGEARRALAVVAVLASFASSLVLLAALLLVYYINYVVDTWSCDALRRARSVAWQLVGLVLQLIALALLW